MNNSLIIVLLLLILVLLAALCGICAYLLIYIRRKKASGRPLVASPAVQQAAQIAPPVASSCTSKAVTFRIEFREKKNLCVKEFLIEDSSQEIAKAANSILKNGFHYQVSDDELDESVEIQRQFVYPAQIEKLEMLYDHDDIFDAELVFYLENLNILDGTSFPQN